MEKQRGSSSSASASNRRSLSSNDPFSGAHAAYKDCEIILESLSRSVVSDFPDLFHANVIENWSEQIIEAAVMNETMKRKVQITETHTNKPNFGSIDGSASSVGRLKALHEAIDVELSGYDGNASTVVKKIRTTLQPLSEHTDDEICPVETGDREAVFMCPFTGTRMDVPMKNTGCRHHISQTGFTALLKNKRNARCPVAGCNATWEKSSASVDENMARRMARFLRVHSASESSTRAAAGNVTYVDADDDGDYTQL